MTAPDQWGQGIALWQMTDPPSIPDAIKAFADGVIPRGVLRFASASARGATLTAPVEGMLTWLQDVNRLDLWDGSSWVAVSVGRSSWTTITPASPWTQDGNSNGTFQYRLLNISGEESLQFRGALARASYPTSPTGSYVVNNTALPSAVRPSTLRTVLIPCSDTSSDRIALKLDVKTDGYLEVFGFSASVKPPWIGFNGVTVSL
ncbi:hypothetical protein [Streptomyces massasporeus]|uniref:hypothetical protein n=1 Tax=Streptomyces massasporeus TaxID=67324 RepID=UPI0016746C4E|nr:hypothetical protein [Streptomyces massasporeus]GGV91531.1 hypothetical protein GCM10010228_82140 [Streptomyces massasporeus]